MENITVAFIGNPNCGKTTLFNAYTGAHVKVANWPGVTVERMEGAIRQHGYNIKLVDLPGTYSLTSYTMEEQVSREFIESDEVDVVIDVADASSLERSLYLTMQLLELGKPVVLALNMMDIVEKRGIDLDLHRLSELLGVPCIPVVARKKKGLKTLMHAVCHQAEESDASNHKPRNIMDESVRKHAMMYSEDIENKIKAIEDKLPEGTNKRWLAINLLEDDKIIKSKHEDSLMGVPITGSEENAIINQKYDYIAAILKEVMLGKENSDSFTDKIDDIVTKPFWGIVIFLGVMLLVFALTFTVGDFFQGYIETFMDWITVSISGFMESIHTAEWLRSLICDGIISGVGAIITFLPNITILFLALAFLEDSGYMARVAYIMNDIMAKLGLSGRAFIPMVLGFGCSVPAIMASRALETKADRRRVMLITPFMSCSAKLPIYVLFSGMFFAKNAMFATYSMYLIGILVALLLAWIMCKMDKAKSYQPLLIELPAYKWPSFHTVWIYVWEKVKDFLSKAGTTIFIASILIWLLMNFGIHGLTTDVSQSFAAIFGHWISPLLVPVGLGFWQIAVALVSGISAKEVVVSSTAVLFGIANVTSFKGMNALHQELLAVGFGPLNAFCMMLFCLLYIPCIATLATIRKESKSTLFMFQSAGFQLLVAWVITFIVYQAGRLLGF